MKKLFALILVLLTLCSCAAKDHTLEMANYNGTSEGYIYWYEEGRNRDWEEDVVFLADMFMQNDPQISGNEFRVLLDEKENYYYSDELYNEELRNEFIERINILMPDITIYQTIEDYKNGIDTVLEAVLAME